MYESLKQVLVEEPDEFWEELERISAQEQAQEQVFWEQQRAKDAEPSENNLFSRETGA